MFLNKIITSNTLHKVRRLELLQMFCKSDLFMKSNKLPLGRTCTILANTKQCLNHNLLVNGSNRLTKFPTTINLGTQIAHKTSTPVGDHVRMWVIERIAAAAMPIIIPAALMTENSVLDGIMSVLVVMHAHWGLEAVITDYARPSVVGTAIPKFLHLSLLILSGVTLTGLFLLINNGPGVSRAIKDAWAIGKNPPSAQ